MSQLSLAGEMVDRLVALLGVDGAVQALDEAVAQFTLLELAAISDDWRNTWARPKQVFPLGDWRTLGFYTARGFGKTLSCGEGIADEVEAGRIGDIGLIAQNEDKTIEVQIEGPTGLIAASPAWFKPRWEATKKQLVWPNGAIAYARSPETPGNIRSGDHHLVWCSEIQSWPKATMQEAWVNVKFATRRGPAKLVWDATPKRRHPILRALLKRAERDPKHHIIVRGTSYENRANLGNGVLEDLEEEFGGTTQGREELHGEDLDEDENALVEQHHIDLARRPMPARLARRVISVDPAVTSRKGSDTTGIIDAGLGVDGQGYVLGNYTGKHRPGTWGTIVLDLYIAGRCDCVVVETNKGGDLVTQNLRTLAESRALTVVVLGKDEPARHVANVVYVREVHARGDKMDRAQPLGTAYEKGRVSHVIGVDLETLEDTLTIWVPAPGADSPGDLDALVHAMKELLDLARNERDGREAFKGIDTFAKELAATPRHSPIVSGLPSLASLLQVRGGVGGRI